MRYIGILLLYSLFLDRFRLVWILDDRQEKYFREKKQVFIENILKFFF